MDSTRRYYSALAQAIQWYNDTTEDFKGQAEDKIRALEKQLPSGSGIDSGSHVNINKSTPQKIVIDTAFHHMDGNGYYDGWTEHKIIITPCLKYGYSIRITGRNKKQIKDYLYDLFDDLSIN